MAATFTSPTEAFEEIDNRLRQRINEDDQLAISLSQLTDEDLADIRQRWDQTQAAQIRIETQPRRFVERQVELERGGGTQTLAREIPALRRPLYDRTTEAWLGEIGQDFDNPELFDWNAASQEELEGAAQLLAQAFPDQGEEIARRVRNRARDLLVERGVLLPDEADQVGPRLANELTRRFSAAGGAMGAGAAADLMQGALQYPPLQAPVAGRGGATAEEAADIMNRLTQMQADNRRLMRLAYDNDTAWTEGLATGLAWLGGSMAVLRRKVGQRWTTVKDEAGRVRLDRRGRPMRREAPLKVSPTSGRGLAEMAGYDAVAGAAFGPEYGPNMLASLTGLEPNRAMTALESVGIGLTGGLIFRHLANQSQLRRALEMPEFADLKNVQMGAAELRQEMEARVLMMMDEARNLSRVTGIDLGEAFTLVRKRIQKDMGRRPGAGARQAETTSMGGEFVDDMPATVARRPAAFEPPALPEAPAATRAPDAAPAPRPAGPDTDAGLRTTGAADESLDIREGLSRRPEPMPEPAANVAGQQDAAYMQAVKAGDTATAQRMVDEAGITAARSLKTITAGDSVDGLKVREEIPNQGSIAASLEDYEIIGLREFPMALFSTTPGKERKLAAAIQESGEINPLIAVMSGHEEGPAYILEGAHRLDALATMGKEKFPALVVYDRGETSAIARDEGGNIIPLSRRFTAPEPAAPPAPPTPRAGDEATGLREFSLAEWLAGEEFAGVPLRTDTYRPGQTTMGADPRRSQAIQARRANKRDEANLKQFREEIYPQIKEDLTPEQHLEIFKETRLPEALERSNYRLWEGDGKIAWLPKGDPREAEAVRMGASVVRKPVFNEETQMWTRGETPPPRAPAEKSAPKLTKAKAHSAYQAHMAIAQLEEIGKRTERARGSQKAKREADRAWSQLSLHAEKLGIDLPKRGTWFDIDADLEKALPVRNQLPEWETVLEARQARSPARQQPPAPAETPAEAHAEQTIAGFDYVFRLVEREGMWKTQMTTRRPDGSLGEWEPAGIQSVSNRQTAAEWFAERYPDAKMNDPDLAQAQTARRERLDRQQREAEALRRQTEEREAAYREREQAYLNKLPPLPKGKREIIKIGAEDARQSVDATTYGKIWAIQTGTSTVTHRPSGLSAGTYQNKETAKQVVRAFIGTGIQGGKKGPNKEELAILGEVSRYFTGGSPYGFPVPMDPVVTGTPAAAKPKRMPKGREGELARAIDKAIEKAPTTAEVLRRADVDPTLTGPAAWSSADTITIEAGGTRYKWRNTKEALEELRKRVAAPVSTKPVVPGTRPDAAKPGWALANAEEAIKRGDPAEIEAALQGLTNKQLEELGLIDQYEQVAPGVVMRREGAEAWRRLRDQGETTPGEVHASGSAVNLAATRPAEQTPDWVKQRGETPTGRRVIGGLERPKAKPDYGPRSVIDMVNDAVRLEMRRSRAQTTPKNPAHYRVVGHLAFTRRGVSQINLHEAGHALKELIEARQPGLFDKEPLKSQLLQLTDLPDSAASARNVHEGVAEWMRRRIALPDTVEGLPVTRALEEAINLHLPGTAAAIRDAARAWNRFQRLPATEKWRLLNLDMRKARPLAPRKLGEAVGEMFEKVIHNAIASGAPLSSLDRRVFRAIKKGRDFLNQSYREALANARRVRKEVTRPILNSHNMLLSIPSEVQQALIGTVEGKGMRIIGPDGNFMWLRRDTWLEIRNRVPPGKRAEFVRAGWALESLDRYEKLGLDYTGKELMPPSELRKVVAQARKEIPNFDKRFKEIQAFFDDVLEIKLHGQLKTLDEVEKMKARGQYWPLPRILETPTGGRGGRANGHIHARDFRARGSQDPVRDLDEVAEERVRDAMELYYLNRHGWIMADKLNRAATDKSLPPEARAIMGRQLVPLRPSRKVAATLGPEEGKAIVYDSLIETMARHTGESPDVLRETIKMEDINLAWNFRDIWRPTAPTDYNVISLLRDGQRHFFQVGDPAMFDYFAASGEVGPLGQFWKWLTGPTVQNWKRMRTQNLPFTTLRNLPGDVFNSMIMNPQAEGWIPGGAQTIGLIHKWTRKYPQAFDEGLLLSRAEPTQSEILKHVKHGKAWNFLAEGFYRSKHPNPTVRWLATVFQPSNWMFPILWKPGDIINLVHGGRYLGPLMESATREGAFVAAKNRGATDEEAKAAYWGVSGRFNEKPGNPGFNTAAETPGFWNPAMQGRRGVLQNLTDPDPAVSGTAWARLLLVVPTVFGLGALFRYMTMDEETRNRERERPIEDRANFYDVFGFKLRFPYGPEGMIGSATWNAVMDHFLERDRVVGPRQARREAMLYMNRFVDSSMFDFLSPQMRAVMEARSNWDSFNQRHIVSPWMAHLPASEQARIETPEFYKKLGRWFNYSPDKIQHIMSNAVSEQVDHTLRLLNRLETGQPIMEPADIPYVGGLFIRDPLGFSAQSVRDYQNVQDRLQLLDLRLRAKGWENVAMWPTDILTPEMRNLQRQILHLQTLKHGQGEINKYSQLARGHRALGQWEEERNYRRLIVETAQRAIADDREMMKTIEDVLRQVQDVPQADEKNMETSIMMRHFK